MFNFSKINMTPPPTEDSAPYPSASRLSIYLRLFTEDPFLLREVLLALYHIKQGADKGHSG